MTSETRDRLFGYGHAFEHPATLWLEAVIGAILAAALLLAVLLRITGKLRQESLKDLWPRVVTWMWLGPLIVLPLLFGLPG